MFEGEHEGRNEATRCDVYTSTADGLHAKATFLPLPPPSPFNRAP